MNATSWVIPPAPLFYRHLQMKLSVALNKGLQDYETQLTLDQECKNELRWWDKHMCRWKGKILLSRETDLVIDSDASQIGWGAACQGQKTGGPRSNRERRSHINCLELMAATLAIQTFAKSKTGISVLLRIDNTTAVAYINNLGGTVSRELITLARDLWMWCLERNIQIVAQHLPGVLNQIGDSESRTMIDRTDWQLNPAIFRQINQPIGSGTFCLQTHCTAPSLFQLAARSLCHSKICISTGLVPWEGLSQPPLVSNRSGSISSPEPASTTGANSPMWKSQPWYPVVLKMLISHPHFILEDYLKGTDHEEEMLMPQLVIWHILGIDTEARTFHKRLPLSCSSH